jgi:hypothetical protein
MPCEAPVTIATFGVGVILNAETPPMRRGLDNCSAGCGGVSTTVPLVCGPTPTAVHPPQHESLHAPIPTFTAINPLRGSWSAE